MSTTASGSTTPGSTTSGRLVVRTAESGDGPALAALDYRCWSRLSDVQERPAPPAPDAVFYDERHLPEHYLLALLDGELVGYIRLVLPTSLPSNAHIRTIHGLAVDPSVRRHGVGRTLIEAALAEARRVGARRVTLRVLGYNAPARALYESLGFGVEGVAPEEFYLDGTYVDDVAMGLTL
ncbi:N-acetyltransferase family protein [Streptacidiphilus sp. N1-12]|uniref:N-acetyltransferase family protein n=2 Tax=Streptacidiphilus alkalitolerans TaxID=3342712 RepID=A0ABV6WB44_9ACTN